MCSTGYTLNSDGFGCTGKLLTQMVNSLPFLQILMNVPVTLMDVVNSVIIQWDHITAHVILDTDSTPQTTEHVMVCICPSYHTILLTDIDECHEHTDGCAHQCNNTISSYYCSCNTGYSLDSDDHSCSGTYRVHLNTFANSLI